MATLKLTQFKDVRYGLAFYLDGKRRRETFSKLREARRRINESGASKGKGLQVAVKEKVAVDGSVAYAINQLAMNHLGHKS